MTVKEFFDKYKCEQTHHKWRYADGIVKVSHVHKRGYETKIDLVKIDGNKCVISLWHDYQEEDDSGCLFGIGNTFLNPSDSIIDALKGSLLNIDGNACILWLHPFFRLRSIMRCEEHLYYCFCPDKPQVTFVWDFENE